VVTVDELEYRGDRAYDEQTTAKVLCYRPDGSFTVATTDDRQLAGVLARESLRALGRA
jgi:hypothetical protein